VSEGALRIVLCGVGALGSTAALFCRNLPASFRFVDFDRVESKNLLAQCYVKPSIGKNKAEATKLQWFNFWGIKADAAAVRLTEQNLQVLLGDADLIVDCFDNWASRALLSGYARAQHKPLVHAAIAGDGSFGLVRWDERFVADREDAAGQATCEGGEHLPLIGLLGATLARAVQDFVKDGAKRDYNVARSGVTALG
jgi:molybdopterin-synthase adenylyltransferase